MAARRIPPIQGLLAFESLARLRSVRLAAEELNVTPSAISHRIRQVETQLSIQLFARSDFRLTAEGAEYLACVRPALGTLQRVPGRVAEVSHAHLRLAATPTFARELLLPRLAAFRRAHPGIELTVEVVVPLLDLATRSDVQIRFGTGQYPDLESIRVLSDVVYPVCSPEYLDEAGPFDAFDDDETIGRARLIRSTIDPWRTWFDACGLARHEPRAGSQFNDLGLALDAAAAGFGVALTRDRLGRAWLDSGRLVRLSPRSAPSTHQHYICWKPGTLHRPECSTFVAWLCAEMATLCAGQGPLLPQRVSHQETASHIEESSVR